MTEEALSKADRKRIVILERLRDVAVARAQPGREKRRMDRLEKDWAREREADALTWAVQFINRHADHSLDALVENVVESLDAPQSAERIRSQTLTPKEQERRMRGGEVMATTDKDWESLYRRKCVAYDGAIRSCTTLSLQMEAMCVTMERISEAHPEFSPYFDQVLAAMDAVVAKASDDATNRDVDTETAF